MANKFILASEALELANKHRNNVESLQEYISISINHAIGGGQLSLVIDVGTYYDWRTVSRIRKDLEDLGYKVSLDNDGIKMTVSWS